MSVSQGKQQMDKKLMKRLNKHKHKDENRGWEWSIHQSGFQLKIPNYLFHIWASE